MRTLENRVFWKIGFFGKLVFKENWFFGKWDIKENRL